MKVVLLYATLVLGAVACISEDSPTQPGTPGEPSLASGSTAANSWSTRAAYPGHGIDRGSAAMAPNTAGQSIVYYLGGTEGEFDVGKPVKAYNVATNSWATKSAKVDVWSSNGAGKIGSRIYFSGGFTVVDDDAPLTLTNQVWAYDFTNDRMIRKADLPIRSASGVSGVIGGKLYVLPGNCSTDGFPDPGYCSKQPTRRFFRYDPAANRWVTRPWAPHFHGQGAAGVIQDKLYVVGGASTALDVYDPATNAWTTLAPIPMAGPAIGAVLSGKFFVIVGHSDGNLRSYEYTPSTNVWKARAAPAFAHDGVVRATLGGSTHLVAVGGGYGFELDTPNASELYAR